MAVGSGVGVGTGVGVGVGTGVGVGVAVGTGVGVGVGTGVGVGVGTGVGVGVGPPVQAPGPAVLSTNPETVPLNCDEVVVPVVFTTTTKLCCAGTVNE